LRELMAKSKTTKSKVEPIDLGEGPVTPIGVDASWTGLAVCALEYSNRVDIASSGQVSQHLAVRLAEVLTSKPGDFPSKSARLLELGRQFGELVDPLHREACTPVEGCRFTFTSSTRSCLVAIEGYSMNSTYGREMAGELCGHLKLLLWQAGIPYIVVPPTLVKKYTTGKGVAAKELMMMTALKRWGYESADNNACDAYCLARIAAEFAAGNWTKKFEALAQGFEVVAAKGVQS
jgi:hypothetical protein